MIRFFESIIAKIIKGLKIVKGFLPSNLSESLLSHNFFLLSYFSFSVAFLIANTTFVIARLATVAVSALVFFYGLSQVTESLDYATGTFNIALVRYSALAVIAAFQAYLLYVFIKRQLKRARENNAPVISKIKPKQQRPKKKDGKKGAISEDDDLPEVDQATKKNLRSRTAVKAK